MKIATLGAGSWGTTVAHLCAHNAPTMLYARDPAVAEAIHTSKENPRYLAGYGLHPDLDASSDFDAVVADAEVVVMGVPSKGFDEILARLAAVLPAGVPVVSLAKGLDRPTGRRMTELIEEALPGHPIGVLTGPNLAKEILAGHAAASVIAFDDTGLADDLQELFSTGTFRVYTNPDRVGCELGGALKNVIAIAAGMAHGLGTGDNTLAAVITRGLAELSRLGVAMGGDASTFMGLAGMGDLVATCMSPQSRNRSVGEALGRGMTIEEVLAGMDQVAEGVKSAPVVVELGQRHGVDLPIAQEVQLVIAGEQSAEQAYRGLLRRPHQGEVARR